MKLRYFLSNSTIWTERGFVVASDPHEKGIYIAGDGRHRNSDWPLYSCLACLAYVKSGDWKEVSKEEAFSKMDEGCSGMADAIIKSQFPEPEPPPPVHVKLRRKGMDKTPMRWFWKQNSVHTHVRVFCNHALCGNLCFRNDEFEKIKTAANNAIEFVEEKICSEKENTTSNA